jgi:glutamate synthase (NADPH/NADH) large chain
VTNPPLDAIREELVTSLYNTIGRNVTFSTRPGIVSPARAAVPSARRRCPQQDRQDQPEGDLPGYQTHVVRGLYDVHWRGRRLTARLDELCAEISAAIADGLASSCCPDRHSNAELAPFHRCCSPLRCTITWSGRRPALRSD